MRVQVLYFWKALVSPFVKINLVPSLKIIFYHLLRYVYVVYRLLKNASSLIAIL